MRNLAVCLVIVFLGLSACSPPTEKQPTPTEVDVAKAVEAASQLQEDWSAAFNARDLDALVDLYLDDAVRMQPDGSQRVLWDIWNRDAPMPAGEGTTSP
jgi:hypothetical protein